MENIRVLSWFSCGDASAVACKLALDKYAATHEILVCRIVIEGEHADNDRFATDFARWTGHTITELRSEKYASPQEVWQDRRYIAGIAGAPCTTELKNVVRKAFQRPDDLHIWGYTVEEQKRAKTFRDNNFELFSEFPLIDAKLGKSDCHALVRAAGIKLPMMYRLGYDNNNCIGCPKGGAGYWNMIRRDFPEKFEWMAKFSRELGCRLIKQDGERIFLDELRLTTGRQKDEVTIECSPHCGDVQDQFIPRQAAE